MDNLPELGPDELLELARPDAGNLTGTARRKAIHDVRIKTLPEMAASGDILIERKRGGWRILPPADIIDRFRR